MIGLRNVNNFQKGGHFEKRKYLKFPIDAPVPSVIFIYNWASYRTGHQYLHQVHVTPKYGISLDIVVFSKRMYAI